MESGNGITKAGRKLLNMKVTDQQKNSAYRDQRRDNGRAEGAKAVGGFFFQPSLNGVPLATVWGSDIEDVKGFLVSQRIMFNDITELS